MKFYYQIRSRPLIKSSHNSSRWWYYKNFSINVRARETVLTVFSVLKSWSKRKTPVGTHILVKKYTIPYVTYFILLTEILFPQRIMWRKWLGVTGIIIIQTRICKIMLGALLTILSHFLRNRKANAKRVINRKMRV